MLQLQLNLISDLFLVYSLIAITVLHFFVATVFKAIFLTQIYFTRTESSGNDESSLLVSKKTVSGKKLDHIMDNKAMKLTDDLREKCLPKMLCEMSAKSSHLLSDKEKNLLELIRLVHLC